MSASQYSISWDSYKSNICNGFAELQQRQEFVDMTLVAEGHLVKVHKNLMSLASPYIKQIILAVPCEHPIIFLNNVSHEILCYLLEYIYTGEVKVEIEKLQTLLNAANDLKLCGLEKLIQKNSGKSFCVLQKDAEDKRSINEFVESNDNLNQFMADEFEDNTLYFNENNIGILDDQNKAIEINIMEATNDFNLDNIKTDHNAQAMEDGTNADINAITVDSTESLPQQYSVSNRGSLQLIFNRFIYYMHHQAQCGRKRRWRCIDYRHNHCPAYIDTIDESITLRKNIHTHPHHDEKIFKKIRLNQVYGSLNTAVRGELCRTLNEESEKCAE